MAVDSLVDFSALEGLLGFSEFGKSDIHVILLNMPPPLYLDRILQRSSTFICADGGANRLYDAFSKDFPNILPTHLCGDLDSVRPDVREFYFKNGVKIESRPSQDMNDIEKCIQLLSQVSNTTRESTLLIVGATGGRFDQTIANMRTLYILDQYFPSDRQPRPILYGERSLITIAKGGESTELIMPSNRIIGKYCGLFPLSGRVDSITTSGLKWDVTDTVLEMSGLVSTSNECKPSSRISLRTSHDTVFYVDTAPVVSPYSGEVLGDAFDAFRPPTNFGFELRAEEERRARGEEVTLEGETAAAGACSSCMRITFPQKV